MPNLAESLQGRDLGHLRIIAEFWGIELAEDDFKEALLRVTTAMLSSPGVNELLNGLSQAEKEALTDLARHSGRLAWAHFTRLHGELREMGVAKRDRDMPYKQPVSAVEALWYRGLVAKAFFDTPAGAEEFAYIPDDLLKHIHLVTPEETARLGRQAFATEYAQVAPARDHILDHACTLLAALRLGISLPGPFAGQVGEELTPAILNSLLAASGPLDTSGMPVPEPARVFLEARRGEALVQLVSSWKHSAQFNELRMLPNLSPEGNWKNDPLSTRLRMLGHLATIPPGTWWSLDSFIDALKRRNPDFQRPAGDYDSWFIRDTRSGEFLRGFEHWDEVDGRLVRFLITGPLYWLGVLDLASPEGSQQVSAFRLSCWAQDLLAGRPPRGLPVENEAVIARSDARLIARRLTPRRVRYQLARFCEWGKETSDEYQYQLTPGALTHARKQGLSVSQLLALLNQHSKAVPPSLVKALERWDKNGSEARMEKSIILRVASVEVMQLLRNSRADRFLGELLGPTITTIKPGAAQKVLGTLAELGYLGEIRGEVEDS